MERSEQPLRTPEKLLNKVALPDETIAEVYGDRATKKMEYIFCVDAEGNIVEYADLSDNEGMREIVKNHFAEKGMALTEKELQYLTWEFIRNKLNMGIDDIDEQDSTEQ